MCSEDMVSIHDGWGPDAHQSGYALWGKVGDCAYGYGYGDYGDDCDDCCDVLVHVLVHVLSQYSSYAQRMCEPSGFCSYSR